MTCRYISIAYTTTYVTVLIYCTIAVMYNKLGEKEKGWEDMKMCARLGDKNVQEFLRSGGVEW